MYITLLIVHTGKEQKRDGYTCIKPCCDNLAAFIALTVTHTFGFDFFLAKETRFIMCGNK